MASNFKYGQVVATCGVANLINSKNAFHAFVNKSITRHLNGDWGDLCEEDKCLNDKAVTSGSRILSAYECPFNEEWKIWIITEADRSATTVLFPHEY